MLGFSVVDPCSIALPVRILSMILCASSRSFARVCAVALDPPLKMLPSS